MEGAQKEDENTKKKKHTHSHLARKAAEMKKPIAAIDIF